MNIVVQHKEDLSDRNYILHPERARAYWANISGGRLKEYLGRCGEAFNIVIVGDSSAHGDFYAIPYGVLKSARWMSTGAGTRPVGCAGSRTSCITNSRLG